MFVPYSGVQYLEGSLRYAVQLVVGQYEVPQVHQALEVGVIQGSETVGIQVECVEVLEVSEGVRQDLTDGVSAQRQVDLQTRGTFLHELPHILLRRFNFTLGSVRVELSRGQRSDLYV